MNELTISLDEFFHIRRKTGGKGQFFMGDRMGKADLGSMQELTGNLGAGDDRGVQTFFDGVNEIQEFLIGFSIKFVTQDRVSDGI